MQEYKEKKQDLFKHMFTTQRARLVYRMSAAH
jgi:hypothetical protein